MCLRDKDEARLVEWVTDAAVAAIVAEYPDEDWIQR